MRSVTVAVIADVDAVVHDHHLLHQHSPCHYGVAVVAAAALLHVVRKVSETACARCANQTSSVRPFSAFPHTPRVEVPI